MSVTECINFEKKLAYHSAPSLMGIKCSNIISCGSDGFDILEQTERFNRKAASEGLKIKLMHRCSNKTLLFVYNEKLLSARLENPESRCILKKYGYDDCFCLENDICRLAERLSEESDFPHEIGILLGYPIEDVKGFIENNGENYKLCGYWKVYGDKSKAEKIFIDYNICRTYLCNKINSGMDFYSALNILRGGISI